MLMDANRKSKQISVTNDLFTALSLTRPAVVSIIGSGGKTTLMYRLAKELISRKYKVITTTTTKIYPPEPDQSPYSVQFSKVTADKIRFIQRLVKKERHITLTAGINQEQKLLGFSPTVLNKLVKLLEPDYLLIEADGAKGKSLKAYRINPQSAIRNPQLINEPVIPSSSQICVLVIGWDILGKPLNERYVHRAKLLSKLIHAKMNSKISISTLIDALCLPEGSISRVPAKCKLIVFINKAKLVKDFKNLTQFCNKLKKQSPRRIHKIVIGSLLDQNHEFVVFK
jgi:probable selenium-dependent hydroxylase accessory protein YqeC